MKKLFLTVMFFGGYICCVGQDTSYRIKISSFRNSLIVSPHVIQIDHIGGYINAHIHFSSKQFVAEPEIPALNIKENINEKDRIIFHLEPFRSDVERQIKFEMLFIDSFKTIIDSIMIPLSIEGSGTFELKKSYVDKYFPYHFSDVVLRWSYRDFFYSSKKYTKKSFEAENPTWILLGEKHLLAPSRKKHR